MRFDNGLYICVMRFFLPLLGQAQPTIAVTHVTVIDGTGAKPKIRPNCFGHRRTDHDGRQNERGFKLPVGATVVGRKEKNS